MLDNLPLSVKGHLTIKDESGNILVDKDNAVHPQNLARVFARSLANESNFWIDSIAFGNGGTYIGSAFTIMYKSVNDGQLPDTKTWDSRLYNETYREIINEGSTTLNSLLGTDPGSADSTGTRPGGGSVPGADPLSIPHVSGPGVRSSELGLTSEVIVSCILNPSEPLGQYPTDNLSPSENANSSFTFDEISLYTSGAPAIATAGSQDVNVGNKTAFDDTGLTANTTYDFFITVDGLPSGGKHITFTTPASGGSGVSGEILFGDLVKALRTGDINWNPSWVGISPLPGNASINITNDGTFHSSLPPAQTYGFLRFFSGTTGPTSTILLSAGTTNNLFSHLNAPTGGVLKTPKNGVAAGVQNDPLNPLLERERMLTHVIFSPVTKSANRTISITYTLTIAVARTVP